MDDHEEVTIEVEPQIGPRLEERGIRAEDIQKVIARAEATKNVFRNITTGHNIACYRSSKTTFWVEYGRVGDLYRIYNAYSHRMEILEGFNLPAKLKKSTDWVCLKCGAPLELAIVKLTYLDETFAAETPACPSCQSVFVSEKDAVEKMTLAEKMLEDK
jgi:hypothetical protein